MKLFNLIFFKFIKYLNFYFIILLIKIFKANLKTKIDKNKNILLLTNF